MQRIARGSGLSLLIVAFAGCQSQQAVVQLGPPPGPVLRTRAAPAVAAIPPAPALPPGAAADARLQPLRGGVTTADVAVPGGIRPGRWQVIVVHHSAADNATPGGMDSYHRSLGWSGLGYHFVIGNGVNYPDGALYVGPRWRRQETGAHCRAAAGRYFGVLRPDNFFNERGIGICLIGNFEGKQPTAKQLETLRELILVLLEVTDIDPRCVYGHGEVTRKTACPGHNVNMAAVRSAVQRALAQRNGTRAAARGS